MKSYDDTVAKLDELNGERPGIEVTRPPELLRVDVGDILTAEIAAPTFVIDTLIPRGHATLLGAHGGAGKSILALAWCCHVACGRPWAGFHADEGKVLYVTLEDPGELVRFRLRRIVEAYNLSPDAIAERLVILDGSGIDGTLAAETAAFGLRDIGMTAIFDQVAAAAKGCSLIVIDNASDAFAGDENSRRQVRRFMRALSQLARDNDAAVLLLAHVDKVAARHGAAGNSYSGSTAWHNTARSRLALATDGDYLTLVHEKSNLGTAAPDVTLSWLNGVIVPSSVDLQRVAADQLARDDADAVLEVVRVAISAGIVVPAAVSGSATTWHALEPLPELPQHFRTPNGKGRVRAAVTALVRDGRLVKVEYRDSHRHARTRLELAQTPPDRALVDPPKGARRSPPYTPTALARADCATAGVGVSRTSSAPLAQLAQPCRKCGGEGCGFCGEASA